MAKKMVDRKGTSKKGMAQNTGRSTVHDVPEYPGDLPDEPAQMRKKAQMAKKKNKPGRMKK